MACIATASEAERECASPMDSAGYGFEVNIQISHGIRSAPVITCRFLWDVFFHRNFVGESFGLLGNLRESVENR